MKSFSKILSFVPLFAVLLISCQTTPYMPPAQPVYVEKIKIHVSDYYGRPDVFADISGRLSSNAAQLVDVKQSREKGNMLIIEVNEQTPRGTPGNNKVPHPPFQTRTPIEVFGLHPGQVYMVNANGVMTSFRMPDAVDEDACTSSSTTGLEQPRY